MSSFATSYIPTTTASATRSADSASMTGTNFSSWYSQTQGTFVVESVLATRPSGLFPPLLQADLTASPSANRLQMFAATGVSNATAGSRIDNTTNQFNTTAVTTYNYDAAFKYALAYAASNTGVVTNGGAVATGGGTIPTVDRMLVGANNGPGYFNGHIRRLTYYPTRLPNATLVALTS